jgi:hypothetical protein
VGDLNSYEIPTLFLAAMSSSRSDVVTLSVCDFVRLLTLPEYLPSFSSIAKTTSVG